MLTYRLDELTDSQYKALLAREDVDISGPTKRARTIIEDVHRRGDKALRTYARRFDGFKGGPLSVSEDEIRSSVKRIPRQVLDALKLSKKRIQAFHRRQMLEPFEFSDESGVLGQMRVPLDRVGVYVPGGSATYMSSVLMACVPARVAGVKELAICTPGRAGRVPDGILAAAELCGVREVHPIGGAHSIAAMAYGQAIFSKLQTISNDCFYAPSYLMPWGRGLGVGFAPPIEVRASTPYSSESLPHHPPQSTAP